MKLISLLPFMDKEDIQELVDKIINKEVSGVSLTMLYPFMETEELDKIVDQIIKSDSYKDLYGALPFLSTTALERIYEQVKQGKLDGFKEEALLPFLGKDKIKDLFKQVVKDAMNNNDNMEEETVDVLFQDDGDNK